MTIGETTLGILWFRWICDLLWSTSPLLVSWQRLRIRSSQYLQQQWRGQNLELPMLSYARYVTNDNHFPFIYHRVKLIFRLFCLFGLAFVLYQCIYQYACTVLLNTRRKNTTVFLCADDLSGTWVESLFPQLVISSIIFHIYVQVFIWRDSLLIYLSHLYFIWFALVWYINIGIINLFPDWFPYF